MKCPAKKTVCIVAFKHQILDAQMADEYRALGQPVPRIRIVHYQAVLDPNRLSATGEFIRFGHDQAIAGAGRGDDLAGWIRLDDLELIEVQAEADESGTLRPWVPEQAKAA